MEALILPRNLETLSIAFEFEDDGVDLTVRLAWDTLDSYLAGLGFPTLKSVKIIMYEGWISVESRLRLRQGMMHSMLKSKKKGVDVSIEYRTQAIEVSRPGSSFTVVRCSDISGS